MKLIPIVDRSFLSDELDSRLHWHIWDLMIGNIDTNHVALQHTICGWY